jgi:hypothetical protein
VLQVSKNGPEPTPWQSSLPLQERVSIGCYSFQNKFSPFLFPD